MEYLDLAVITRRTVRGAFSQYITQQFCCRLHHYPAIDDQTERTFVTMMDQEDKAPGKPRVPHARRGNKQPTSQIVRNSRLGPLRCHLLFTGQAAGRQCYHGHQTEQLQR